jgi:hypothetical protein
MANVELRIKSSLFTVVVKANIYEMFHSCFTSKLEQANTPVDFSPLTQSEAICVDENEF